MEWDAPYDYLVELGQGAELASHYLYDATDGQMFFEWIYIYEDRNNWSTTDYHVQLHNRTWPCADPGGIEQGVASDRHIYIGRVFGRGAFPTPSWVNWDAYPTMDHEFRTLPVGLYDEYLFRDGSAGGSARPTTGGSRKHPVRA